MTVPSLLRILGAVIFGSRFADVCVDCKTATEISKQLVHVYLHTSLQLVVVGVTANEVMFADVYCEAVVTVFPTVEAAEFKYRLFAVSTELHCNTQHYCKESINKAKLLWEEYMMHILLPCFGLKFADVGCKVVITDFRNSSYMSKESFKPEKR